MNYPENWPRCPVCGDYAMDGHITCGRYKCNEAEARNTRQDSETVAGLFMHIMMLRKEMRAIANLTTDPAAKSLLNNTLARSLRMEARDESKNAD